MQLKFPKLLRIIRVHIVVGGAFAFSLGALLAIVGGGTFNPLLVVIFYAIVFCGDLSTHFSNDYFDIKVDKYIEQKKFFAGKNILVNHPELRGQSRKISIFLLSTSITLAILLVLFQVASLELLIITVGANFLGWFYSAPPLRLISRGLGEVALAVSVGFAIPALGYMSVRGALDQLFVFFVFPFVMYALMLSLSLEAPDREIDLKGAKRNLVVRNGERTVFALILTSASLAFLMFFFINLFAPFTAVDFRYVILFSIVPLLAGLVGCLRAFNKDELNRLSALVVSSLFVFNVLMISYLFVIALAR